MKLTASLFAKSALATSLAIVLFHSEEASACASEPLVGSVCYMATDYCPRGFVRADGQLLQINANQALFSLLGNIYGGQVSSGTFGVPDLRGRSVVGVGQGTGLSVNVVRGQMLGAETATLTVNNLAMHAHGVTTVTPASDNVTVPSIPGTLSVTAALPLSTTTPASGGAAPIAGLNYLSAISATVPVGAGTQNATFKGPYVQTKPAAGTTLPADVVVSGSPTIPTFSIKVPETVVGMTGANMPFSVRDPAIGLTACIAAQGIYPERP